MSEHEFSLVIAGALEDEATLVESMPGLRVVRSEPGQEPSLALVGGRRLGKAT